MTLKLIQQRSRDLRAKTRRKLLGTLAGPLAAGLFCAFGMKVFAPLREVLQLLFASACAWSLAGLYFLNRGMWSAVMPGDAGLDTGLDFCRREIERQRDLVRRLLLWSFGPIMLAIGTFILALAMAKLDFRHLGASPSLASPAALIYGTLSRLEPGVVAWVGPAVPQVASGHSKGIA